MKKLIVTALLAVMPTCVWATDYTDTDQMYGWNPTTTTQFWQTWADHKTQLGAIYAPLASPTFTGGISIAGTTSGGQYVSLLEDTDEGTNYAGFAALSAITNSYLVAPQATTPTAGNILTWGSSVTQTMSDGTSKTVFPTASITPGTGVATALAATANGTGGLATIDGTKVLTNTTLDANATGNVVKGYGYIVWTKPHNRGTATGVVGTTETTQLYGVPAFADDVETNNYVDYIGVVPPDLDTSVALTASFKFRLGGADTADHSYKISMIDIADSAAAAGTPADSITLAYTADGSGADGDIETATGTLTDWAAALTTGTHWLIRVTRDGDDGTNDASTVDSYPMSLTIRYGFSQ
jgi:hypothetical protein